MKNIIQGGWMAGRRTYIISAVGIVSAVGAYLVGDIDVFGMLQTIFTLGGMGIAFILRIHFVHLFCNILQK